MGKIDREEGKSENEKLKKSKEQKRWRENKTKKIRGEHCY
jgi:hypothetical protein